MYKKTLAVASFALCAAMPFTAGAQSTEPTVEDEAYCRLKVAEGIVFADLGTENGIEDCLNAVVVLRFSGGLLPVIPTFINMAICMVRGENGLVQHGEVQYREGGKGAIGCT